MIDHVSIGSHDLRAAKQFYLQVFAELGFGLELDTDKEIAFGPPSAPCFWVYPSTPERALASDRAHYAFTAPSRDAVRRAYDQALKGQAHILREPAKRPEINSTYFGTMFHDLDGHVIEIVCNQEG